MPETTGARHVGPRPRRRTSVAIGAVVAIAVGSTALGAVPAAVAEAPQPAPTGAYVSAPSVAPDGAFTVDFIGETAECGDGGDAFSQSWAFVDAAASTPLPSPSEANSALGVTSRDGQMSASIPDGTAGSLQLTCTPSGGGAAQTISLPLTVRSGPTATRWSWSITGPVGAGAVVTASAFGFTPGEQVTASITNVTRGLASGGDLSGAVAAPVGATVDGSGAVTVDIVVPSGWVPGDDLDLSIAGATSRFRLASGPGTPMPLSSTEALSTSGAVFSGGDLVVRAGGFAPAETVTFSLHPSTGSAEQVGALVADAGGGVAGTLRLPADAPAGVQRLWGVSGSDDGRLVSAALTVAASPEVVRISGEDRYQTAVATAQAFAPFDTGTGTVYLTSGNTFPDALGAGALAASIGAPVLLTAPEVLPDAVRAELLRLRPATVKVVGGTSAVSDAVLSQVTGLAFAHGTTRIGGSDRFETNRLLIADALRSASTVYLAIGSNFPDALAAGPAAASLGGAVVLVDGGASTVDAATLRMIAGLGVRDVRLVGGRAAMSAGIQSQLEHLYPGKVTRYAGADRYDTAAQIVAAAWPGAVDQVLLASGANFPDALAAGALGVPMLTSGSTCVSSSVLDRLAALQPKAMSVVGGTTALTPAVAALKRC